MVLVSLSPIVVLKTSVLSYVVSINNRLFRGFLRRVVLRLLRSTPIYFLGYLLWWDLFCRRLL